MFFFSHPRFKAPNRPRSGWLGNTKTEPNHPTFGHCTAKLPIGSSLREKIDLSTKSMSQSPSLMAQLRNRGIFSNMRFVLFLFFVTITFASFIPQTKNVTIATFNVHGLSSSTDYIRSCISSYGGIWMLQEHWLSELQLQQLQQLNTQYVARSGMEDAVTTGVFRGRPFGGVAICWSSDLNELVTPIVNYKHKRVVAVELAQASGNILLICSYMPFYNASRREHCIAETIDAIAMIELLIEEHPNHHIIIGGDLNTELNGASPFDRFWANLITKNSLIYCDSQFSGPQYTYRHETLNQSKFNDHFLISHSLADKTRNHKILMMVRIRRTTFP